MTDETEDDLPLVYRDRDPAAHPPRAHVAYGSTRLRAPSQAPLPSPRSLSEATGPGPVVSATIQPDADLTTNAGTGSPALGERIILTGRVLDEDGRAVPHTLVEVWQANAAGRYRHDADRHDAPLDPNFTGAGRCVTDADGAYRFLTIRPGAYPWGNHPNAWRPAHVHFSVLGPSVSTRLVTQMYFPGDPLHELDPILQAVPGPAARARLVASYDHDVTESGYALGYRWDVVLRGPDATWSEPAHGGAS